MGRSDDSFRALAGATGGFTSGIVTCPLDVIKTKLQAQGGFRPRTTGVPSHVVYSGLIGTGKVIWREEGLRGMYRGLGPIILGYLPTWAVYFTVYGRSKVFFSSYIENTYGVNFCSSLVAVACSTMVTNPIWVIKTILREEGWRAFYAGMGTNMMRAVPAATTTMLTYEFVMKNLNDARAEGIQKSSAW